jgi:hypothetical protein
MRRPSLFRKSDLIRAANAVHAAGMEVDRVEIDKDGKITVVAAGKARIAAETVEKENEWDSLG